MRTNIALLILTFALFISCGEKKDEVDIQKDGGTLENILKNNQLNISILLDLSDRLIQDVTPPAKERDIEIIKTIIRIFKKDMIKKGAFRTKGKIRILFNPAPVDPQINSIAQNLKYDLSVLDVKQKKPVYDSIDSSFHCNLTSIYDQTLITQKWEGSDIWRFFKNDVKDYCVDKNSDYRNILVILTDGYIYHKQSTDRIKNRTSFLTGNYLQQEGFRNNPNWEEKFESKDYGLITNSNYLKNLEILVLEVNPSTVHKNDEDIIRTFLKKWFDEMGIERYEIYNTDLPSNTSQRIVNFFND